MSYLGEFSAKLIVEIRAYLLWVFIPLLLILLSSALYIPLNLVFGQILSIVISALFSIVFLAMARDKYMKSRRNGALAADLSDKFGGSVVFCMDDRVGWKYKISMWTSKYRRLVRHVQFKIINMTLVKLYLLFFHRTDRDE